MSEGSLEAPIRHAIDWRNADFTDADLIDAEMRRVFDICHGCRRCFNLCGSFPRLFDLIDDSRTGELDAVDSADFKAVVDDCTLCDMCFMTKCPYVPPHEFNLDFPHLMLRYRAMEFAQGRPGLLHRQMVETDRNGRLGGAVAPLANWALKTENRPSRRLAEAVAGIHRDAKLPAFHAKTLVKRAATDSGSGGAVNRSAPGFGRKAVIYATCFCNYNSPAIGEAAIAVLAKNGVETETVHPRCCGMPQLEQGNIARVAENAAFVAAELGAWIDKGYDVIALVPSCALMVKFEWPLILPENTAVARLARATSDISEYIVDIAKNEGLADGLGALDGGVTLHLACHARAQNMGPKAAEMLRFVPGAEVKVIERCSGHGGSWGVMKKNFDLAFKIGLPAARQAAESGARYTVSECPLAAEHIAEGAARLGGDAPAAARKDNIHHPIELMARAYGL